MKARVLSSFFDCVRHTLKSLELSKHQYVAAVHTDTDNLHVHVAVNRVHPETGYINWLSLEPGKKLSRACRELELKHGFAPDNGCFVHAPGNRIVRKTALVRERRNALATREKSRRSGNILRRCRLPGYVKSLHRTGYLYINGWPAMVCISRCRKGELVVKDGWDRAREGVALSSFGPSWTAEKLGRKLGGNISLYRQIFSVRWGHPVVMIRKP